MIKNKFIDINQIIIIFGILGLLVYFMQLGPLPQVAHYHQFANGRFFLVPNFQNVVSNLIFLFASLYGALFVDYKKIGSNEKIYLFTLIFGVFLTSVGSAYYHYAPNTETLFWDRLPMSFGFIGFVMWLLSKTAVKKNDLALFIVGLVLAVGSVIYWSYTESIGQGDLRPYLFVQFGAMLATLLVVILYRQTPYPRKACFYMLLFYVFAKISESYDLQIYEVSSGLTSGHALKHLLAGYGIYLFFKNLPERKVQLKF